jgi:pyrroloquinoline-quinone synthase
MNVADAARLSDREFIDWLHAAGGGDYHDRHPFHQLMHGGRLTKRQLQEWVRNRYYYQTRLPLKDALIVAKSDDRHFRRQWITRIHLQDGFDEDKGGLALWLRLAEGVGLDPQEVETCGRVLPGVRAACDRYVTLVRDFTLLEAVALSLTELFAPRLMAARLEAWETHYPWVDATTLGYFRARVTQARVDSEVALTFVTRHAETFELQSRCIQALKTKNEILWTLLDHVHAAYVEGTDDDR